MKFIYSLLVFGIICCQTLFAQIDKPGIEGFIKEDASIPVEFATIALYSWPDSTLLKGVMADENGYYKFQDLSYGSYYLLVTNLGYKKTFSQKISLTKETPLAKSDLQMDADITESQTIVIEAQRSLIKQEAGSTVLNVENSTLNAGLSVVEVMKRVPGVTVDKDGQVKLKGKDGVMVMIDDKPLYMDASQVAALMKSIPADQVKEIEVLTSPSAKYDAAGNAGIINIKLKRGAYEGLNGSATTSAGYGMYPKANAGINLSYKKKRVTIGGGYQYNYKKNYQKSYINRDYIDYGDSAYYTSSLYRPLENTQTFLLNGSYELSKKGTLSWDGNFMHEDARWQGSSDSYLHSPDGGIYSSFVTKDDSKAKVRNLNSGIGYKHKFDTTGTDLYIGVEYKNMNSQSAQYFTTNYFDGAGNSSGVPFDYQSNIPLTLDQWSIKADFAKMLLKKVKMETGVKYNRIETQSDMSGTLTPSNNFVYKENIPAAYLLLQQKLRKWNVSVGLRMEYTQNKGIQKSIDSTIVRKYTNFFPSTTISYQATKQTSYSILYSKRIERPPYADLNPFSYYSDPYNLYAGNPYLRPQYTHHTELTMSNWNGVLLSTLNYSYTTQPQLPVWILNSNDLTTIYTTRNLTSQQNMGISFSLNTSVSKWWTMSNYIYVYSNRLKGDVGYGVASYNRNALMCNATHTFKLPYKFSGEISGNYESPNYFGTMLYRQVWQLSAGLQKKLWKEKISLKLAITDIFWKYVYLGEGTFGGAHATDGYKWDNRVVMFTLNYRFGKKIGSDDSEKKSGENESGGRKR